MLVYYFIYLLLSAIACYLLSRHSLRSILLKFIVVATLPVIGWFLPLLGSKRQKEKNDIQFDEYVERQQEEHKVRRIGIYQNIQKKKELDIIPIEEALLISENFTRRRVMIDVLKDDSFNYIELLQSAVSNEDSETSHYAVSAIMEAKRKLLLSLQDLSVKYEQNKSDQHIVSTYAEILRSFIGSGFIDNRTLLKYRFTYRAVLDQMLELTTSEQWVYQEKIDLEIVLELFADAEATAALYLEMHPESEEAYLALMKIYYITRSYNKLKLTLQKLRSAPLRLSNSGLTLVRFWSEGA